VYRKAALKLELGKKAVNCCFCKPTEIAISHANHECSEDSFLSMGYDAISAARMKSEADEFCLDLMPGRLLTHQESVDVERIWRKPVVVNSH